MRSRPILCALALTKKKVNYLRHAEIIATSDVVEALAENGISSIDLSAWIGSGTTGDASLLLHPKLLESITAPGNRRSERYMGSCPSPGSSNQSQNDQDLAVTPPPRSHVS